MVVLRFQLNHLWLHRVHTEPSKQESIMFALFLLPQTADPFSNHLQSSGLFLICSFLKTVTSARHDYETHMKCPFLCCLENDLKMFVWALDGRVWSPSFPSAHDRLIIPPLLVCLLCESLICLSLPRFPSFAPHSFLPFSSPTGFLCVALAAGTLCFI